MIQNTIPPTDESRVLEYLSAGGRAYGDHGFPKHVRRLYAAFGEIACRKRLRLMEEAGLVELFGAGRNRQARLTVAGMNKATGAA